LNVISHLENEIAILGDNCSKETVAENIKKASSISDADSYLSELVKMRTEINKKTILCEKLKHMRA